MDLIALGLTFRAIAPIYVFHQKRITENTIRFFGRCYAEILIKTGNFACKLRFTGDHRLNFSTEA
ncbi:hypothetical protein G7B40_018930 [Aetokthonos hydrillicola Thurmond2011]|jgi:hypothetical protein|uniref:Uncharacterized protein n=1 Tax=Aetokthonos hydrillicola Thurmond2011 TaxID=2712845 RepID=A0AAP5I863_9CYAN|nr:hypothetical protein [Aetokthonos hydrillicola]MBO3457868.1 hypothetical protein [Aetokthonos hydrillicola CCALA 1050]MBW4587354.1 hypothetical protein [Aetokthonos hydrillicola CCALA 1050]MDR9896621.1 hypothetical protein [Aetokthonos hydrillicola Thurmond2011]